MADNTLPPLPKDHLDHPEQWATGAEPATDKQKGYVEVLQKQHPDLVPEGGLDTAVLGKSEASEVIDKLRSGEQVDGPTENKVDGKGNVVEAGVNGHLADGDSKAATPVTEARKESADVETKAGGKEEPTGSKRKAVANGSTADEAADTADAKDAGKDKHPSRQLKLDEVGSKSEDAHASKRTRTEQVATDDDSATREASANSLADDPAPTTPIDLTKEPSDPTPAVAADGQNGDTVPGDGEHLDHPENWATGDDPATDKQKGFIKVLEKQKGATGGDVDHLGKSEASAKIDELKQM